MVPEIFCSPLSNVVLHFRQQISSGLLRFLSNGLLWSLVLKRARWGLRERWDDGFNKYRHRDSCFHFENPSRSLLARESFSALTISLKIYVGEEAPPERSPGAQQCHRSSSRHRLFFQITRNRTRPRQVLAECENGSGGESNTWKTQKTKERKTKEKNIRRNIKKN